MVARAVPLIFLKGGISVAVKIITASEFVKQARNGNYIGIPYKTLDCQAFVEKVLKDCGCYYDWVGSNHMWRDALSYKAKITDYDRIPAGAWVFTVKNDGGEMARGYRDDQGNARHVGIYLGGGEVIHSTTGGVQMDRITSSRWTHYGTCKYIQFGETASDTLQKLVKALGPFTIEEIIKAIREEWG